MFKSISAFLASIRLQRVEVTCLRLSLEVIGGIAQHGLLRSVLVDQELLLLGGIERIHMLMMMMVALFLYVVIVSYMRRLVIDIHSMRV